MKTLGCNLADIARLANVSRTTVSKVLLETGGDRVRVSSETADLIWKLARANNYRPNQAARQLKGIDSKTIALLIYSAYEASEFSQSFMELVLSLEKYASLNGFKLILSRILEDDNLEQRLLDLQAGGVGYLFCFMPPKQLRIVEEHQQRFRTVVVLFSPERNPADSFVYVRLRRREALAEAADYLFRQGRKRIALLLHPEVFRELVSERADAGDALDRLSPALVRCDADYGNYLGEEAAERMFRELIAEGKADAVICSNDYWALSMLESLRVHAVRVPDEVALIGFDNLAFGSCVRPQLTTFDQQFDQTGKVIMEYFLGRRTRQETPYIDIVPKLVRRGSA